MPSDTLLWQRTVLVGGISFARLLRVGRVGSAVGDKAYCPERFRLWGSFDGCRVEGSEGMWLASATPDELHAILRRRWPSEAAGISLLVACHHQSNVGPVPMSVRRSFLFPQKASPFSGCRLSASGQHAKIEQWPDPFLLWWVGRYSVEAQILHGYRTNVLTN